MTLSNKLRIPNGGSPNKEIRLITPINQHKHAEEVSIDILHVDDDRDFIEMAAEFIEQADDGFSVTTETRVDQGLDRLEQERFDCVVSDYQMPKKDGLDFLDAVRREYPDLPFVLFTGHGSEEIASEAISRGVTDYLQKEVGTDQYEILANRVRNAVDSYRTNQELLTTLSWYQRLVEQNLAGIYLIQQDEFIYVNERLADIFGYTQAELIGASPTQVVDPEDHKKVLENLRRREKGEVNNIHYSLKGERKDGSPVDVEAHGGLIQFEGTPAVMGLLLEKPTKIDDG